MLNLLKKRFRPLRHSDFRAFFFAQWFSAIGTWSHELTRSWLILDLAGTTSALGALLLCNAVPGLFLTLYGGAFADRANQQKVLFITKSILTVSAFTLFGLVLTHHYEAWTLMLFAGIEGFVNAFDGPSFTALFARLTPREDFQQSLAIQSMSFHISRMLGPTVAGLIIAWQGPAYVFLFDGLSYLGVLIILTRIHLREKEGPAVPPSRGRKAFFDGIKYFFRDKDMRFKQLQQLASLMIILPLLNVVFRSFLKEKYHLTASEFGYMFALPGLGAMVGATYFTLAALKNPMRNLLFGVPAIIVALLVTSYASSAGVAAAMLGLCGFCQYLNMASITQSMHLITPDSMRGRLGSLITLGFSSISPLMSFPIGVYTDFHGFNAAILHLTLIFAAVSLALAYRQFLFKPASA